MAIIHGPGHPPVIRPQAQGGQAAVLPTAADALARLGLLKGGMDPQAALQKLLGFLVLQGFMPKVEGSKAGGQPLEDAAQLAQALKNLQAKEGLPQTGKLDDKTLKALEKYKQATSAGERSVERQSAPPEKQAAARTLTSFKDQSLAAWIKNKTADPQVRLPHQLPVNQSPLTQAPLQQPPQVLQAQAKPNPLEQPPPPVHANPQDTTSQTTQILKKDVETRSLQTDGRATREAGDGKPPPTQVQGGKTGQGDGEGAGRLASAGQGDGSAVTQPGGNSHEDVGLARGDADQLVAYEDGRGNHATGDENEEDERRGAALVDDGSGADEGAYEVPSLYDQIEAALNAMEREDSPEDNRPATYHVDFQLYRPGTYQSATMAPQVLNLKVDKATAYDEVWSEVMDEINKRLDVLEPYAPRLDFMRVHSALQLSRARSS